MRRGALFLLLVLVLSLTMAVASVKAQGGAKVQEFYSAVSADNRFVYFDLFDMQAGETIYLYAESDEIDTYLIVCDIACEEFYAENDDIDTDGGNYNSALEFTFPEDGDYSVAVVDCCDEEAEGIFRLLLGFNAPNVLDGSANPNGANIAVPFPDTYVEVSGSSRGGAIEGEVQVQEFVGNVVGGDDRWAYYDIFGAEAGQTLYAYVESNDIDPYLVICDIDCAEIYAENDDIDTDGGNYNSALEFTFPEDGDYSIAVADCCDEEVSGEFRLLLGYNAPDVLDGTATPNGFEIAVPYDPNATSTSGFDITTMDLPEITGPARVQEFYAVVAESVEFSYFDLFGMQAGESIYVYAESEEIDTYIAVCDIDCEEIYIENDDIDADAGNFNSALVYTFEEDGDYSIVVTDCCRSDVKGVFHLLVGFNAPDVLTGNALPTGGQVAIPYEPTYFPITPENAPTASGSQVQQFVGEVTPDGRFVYYDIFDAVAGETLYLYAESDEIDTYLVVCDIECVDIYAENDDISERNFNSAIEFTFPEDGDYSIAVADCCDENATGSFLVQLGYNAPEVLRGDGTPNGAEIAQEYIPVRADVAEVERDASASCEDLELGERPELSGPVQTVGTENFLIHYTLSGEDATTEAFVQEVLSFVERVLEVQTIDLLWPLPPSDCGEGGDARFDFYLVEILDEGILGYAQPENIVGDNPNSETVETWAGYSFLAIDNDFQGVSPPLAVMRATVAHEFHHAVQFGYDVADPFNWYYESTASWIETQTSPADEDATNYTPAVFRQSDLCIGTLQEDSGVRVYGEWLLIDSIAQDYGNDGIRRIWQYMIDLDGMDSFYAFMDEVGSSPQEAVQRYAVRNLLLAYELGESLPETITVEATINEMGRVTPRDGVQELSYDYVLIRRRGNYTFSIDRSNLSIIVVGIDRGSGEAQVFDLGQRGTVDTTVFSNAYVIIMNNEAHSDPNNCSFTDWELEVSDGSGEAQSPSTGEVFDATRFIPAG